MYNNPEFDELIVPASAEMDIDEQNRILKEAGVLLNRDIPVIGLSLLPARQTCWPWVKNWYGENSICDDAQFGGIARFIWIDQDLKAEMGFK